jgi:ABC-type transport system involved in cytochrome c biogenesis permease subunit
LAARTYLTALNTSLASPEQGKMARFPLELVYHSWRPFLVAKVFYILCLFFFVASFFSSSRLWYKLSFAAVILGFVPHALALLGRIIIMGRPPVSNLYETFIFVSFIAVVLGILIERANRQWLGLVVAGVSGTVLLFIASKYSAEGDTLQMLIAVLNSNFWLATHVTTITMGYASTCVAGILGHIWLVQAVGRKKQGILDNTYSVMNGILGLSLALTFLGTNLGGIWADQSWGRFWGWDPKENGALMIVLWSAMLFHARFAKMIDDVYMAVGTVLGMVVVMWAWFGVNLLSIGLHSYGFTSGIANSLLIYVVCEIIFLVVCTSLIRKR